MSCNSAILIEYYLTFSEQHFSYMYDENKFSINELYRNEGRNEQKKMESCEGRTHLVFCSGCNAPILFFEIYKRGLKRIGSVAFSKHVTHYGPRSDFPYNNMTTPYHREGSPYPGTRWAAMWVWALCTFTSSYIQNENKFMNIINRAGKCHWNDLRGQNLTLPQKEGIHLDSIRTLCLAAEHKQPPQANKLLLNKGLSVYLKS